MFVYFYCFTAGRIFQRSFSGSFCIDADLSGFCIPGPPDIGCFDGIAAFRYFDGAECGTGGIIGSLCSVCHDRRGSSAFDGYFTGGRIYDSNFRIAGAVGYGSVCCFFRQHTEEWFCAVFYSYCFFVKFQARLCLFDEESCFIGSAVISGSCDLQFCISRIGVIAAFYGVICVFLQCIVSIHDDHFRCFFGSVIGVFLFCNPDIAQCKASFCRTACFWIPWYPSNISAVILEDIQGPGFVCVWIVYGCSYIFEDVISEFRAVAVEIDILQIFAVCKCVVAYFCYVFFDIQIHQVCTVAECARFDHSCIFRK